MALKKFARRDVILPAVVFLLTFVVALFSLRLLSLNQEKDERLRAVYAAESTISRVSSQLNRYLAESDFIKKYIESGRVLREEEFAAISSNMQDGSSVIKTHELAKDGVVSQVYPVAGNEAAIGLDMLHNPARKKEANLAKNSGMYTIAGPFELVQGGTGALLWAKQIIGRLGVFRPDTLEAWYAYFSTGEAQHFFALMQTLPSAAQ